MIIDIEITYTRNTYIGSICTMNTWIGSSGVRNTCIKCVKPKTLIELEIILANLGQRVGDHCLLSSIGLIFASIERISC